MKTPEFVVKTRCERRSLCQFAWKSGPFRAASPVRDWMASKALDLKVSPSGNPIRGAKAPLFHNVRVFARCMGAFASGCLLLLSTIAPAQVTFERLVNSAKEPQNWMTYSGDYPGK